MITVRDMFAFIRDWDGAFFSECAGLRSAVENDPRVLDQPIYVYATTHRLVFTTAEGDTGGFMGSSFIAVLN